MPNTDQNLQRASSRIQGVIVCFCKSRLAGNSLFYMEDLRRYIEGRSDLPFAPASPDRVLRSMRQKGAVRYEVVNRSKSLYKMLAVS